MKTLEGLLAVDKPVGPTSHDVVRWIRRASGIRRVGHAGTLDPFASGLLLVLMGSSTRLAEYFLLMEKEYEAVVDLGVETTSHDPEGDVVSTSSRWRELAAAEVERALDQLRGRILQTPPAYSAKKVAGVAAHRRVRRGEAVELSPVEVEVHELRMVDMSLPEVHLQVRCSSGTYIRALARDLGRTLGVGGHLSSLRRTRIGSISVEAAPTPDVLESPEEIHRHLIPAGSALGHLPSVEIDAVNAIRIRQGQAVETPPEGAPAGVPVRIMMGGELVAIGSCEGDRLRPRKVFSDG